MKTLSPIYLLKHWMIPVLIFFILAFSTQAGTTILSDDFSYLDAFALHDWQFIQGCGVQPSTPINSSFGLNTTDNGCGFTYTTTIRKTMPFNYSNGTTTMFFNFQMISADQTLDYLPLIISYKTAPASGTEIVTLSLYPQGYIKINSNLAGGVMCNVSGVASGTKGYVWVVDWINELTYLTVEGVPYCSAYYIGDVKGNLEGISVSEQFSAHEPAIKLLNDILITYSGSPIIPIQPAGNPCTSNANCSTGYCLNGMCQYRIYGQACTLDTQCESQKCQNGYCTMPSVSQGMDMLRRNFIGDDIVSSSIVSFVIMLGLTIIIVMVLGRSGQIQIASYAGITVFYVSAVLFCLIGWLSAWIMFVMILLLVIAGFFMILVKSNAGGGG